MGTQNLKLSKHLKSTITGILVNTFLVKLTIMLINMLLVRSIASKFLIKQHIIIQKSHNNYILALLKFMSQRLHLVYQTDTVSPVMVIDY